MSRDTCCVFRIVPVYHATRNISLFNDFRKISLHDFISQLGPTVFVDGAFVVERTRSEQGAAHLLRCAAVAELPQADPARAVAIDKKVLQHRAEVFGLVLLAPSAFRS
jgi:hypothetical protein